MSLTHNILDSLDEMSFSRGIYKCNNSCKSLHREYLKFGQIINAYWELSCKAFSLVD